MIIDNFKIYAFKYAVAYREFEFLFYDTEFNKILRFASHDSELSKQQLFQMLADKTNIFIGYNNTHYENPLTNFVVGKKDLLKDCGTSSWQTILYNTHSRIMNEKPDMWIDLKYGNYCTTMDFMSALFGKNAPSLREWSLREGLEVPDDTTETKCRCLGQLIEKHKADIEARINISIKHHVDVLDKNGNGGCTLIFKQNYAKLANISVKNLEKRPFKPFSITGGELLERVGMSSFKLAKTNFADAVLDNQKDTKIPVPINDTQTFMIDGGGGRIEAKNGVYRADRTNVLYLDVKSMFPTIRRNWHICPQHLQYVPFESAYMELVDLKFSTTGVEQQYYKNGINSILGQFNMADNWLYDPETHLRLRMAAAAVMYELIDMLKPCVKTIIMANIDSIVIEYYDNVAPIVKNLIEQWMAINGLNCTAIQFKTFAVMDFNNYFGMSTSDNFISSGIFTEESVVEPAIVKEAVVKNVLENYSIYDTIKCQITKDSAICYSMIVNEPKAENVFYGGEVVQKSQRVIMSLGLKSLAKGATLKTAKPVIKNTAQILYNTFDTKVERIDYTFYINRANTLLSKIKPVQTNLFD